MVSPLFYLFPSALSVANGVNGRDSVSCEAQFTAVGVSLSSPRSQETGPAQPPEPASTFRRFPPGATIDISALTAAAGERVRERLRENDLAFVQQALRDEREVRTPPTKLPSPLPQRD